MPNRKRRPVTVNEGDKFRDNDPRYDGNRVFVVRVLNADGTAQVQNIEHEDEAEIGRLSHVDIDRLTEGADGDYTKISH